MGDVHVDEGVTFVLEVYKLDEVRRSDPAGRHENRHAYPVVDLSDRAFYYVRLEQLSSEKNFTNSKGEKSS